MRRTVIIAGGGPAGLSLGRSLAGSPHRVIVIERQQIAALAAPPPDGREIALTIRSEAILKSLGVWQRLPAPDVHPLREARVRNGSSRFAMAIDPQGGNALGHIVSNHLIRRALFESLAGQTNVELLCGRRVETAVADQAGVQVTLDDGASLTGDLLIAADSRFSGLRKQLGVGASITPFGHTMLVARIAHSMPHLGTSTEWFDHGRTIALLPLEEGRSGIVVTLEAQEAQTVCALPDAEIEALFSGYLKGEWGRIALLTRPHAYPLVMTYAASFSGPRWALIGDAAVGMHPVTAHGFNFGLLSAWRLANLIREAPDPGVEHLLRRYGLQHRLATLPLYEATRQLVKLYTDDRLAARPVRAGVLRLGALRPVSRMMGRLLSDAHAD